ncbi:hypothetical protein FA13DRAFT_1741778 [Coprinellus micaceus]|uniref:Uncharacterized protein n=1 Tax=Coprinellus micaceus TaxID=71717 RepID=A0A4Y7SI64_COPMI|nr:hypothetical protein FA13DRAFT_1741778 [Coprinellus micaceus]
MLEAVRAAYSLLNSSILACCSVELHLSSTPPVHIMSYHPRWSSPLSRPSVKDDGTSSPPNDVLLNAFPITNESEFRRSTRDGSHRHSRSHAYSRRSHARAASSPTSAAPHSAPVFPVRKPVPAYGSSLGSTGYRIPSYGSSYDGNPPGLEYDTLYSAPPQLEDPDEPSYPPKPITPSQSLGRPLTREHTPSYTTWSIANANPISISPPNTSLPHTHTTPIPRLKPPFPVMTTTSRPHSEFTPPPTPRRVPVIAPRPRSEFKSRDDESRDILSRMAAHTRTLSEETKYQGVQPRIRAPQDDSWKRGSREVLPRPQSRVVDSQALPGPRPQADVQHEGRRQPQPIISQPQPQQRPQITRAQFLPHPRPASFEGSQSRPQSAESLHHRLKKRREVWEIRGPAEDVRDNIRKWNPFHYIKGITAAHFLPASSFTSSISVCLGRSQEVPAINPPSNPMHVVHLNRPQNEEDEEQWTRVHLGFDMTPVRSRRESDAYTVASVSPMSKLKRLRMKGSAGRREDVVFEAPLTRIQGVPA